jgi:UDP-N-acetylmuramoylalanine--D-glutamate ligase
MRLDELRDRRVALLGYGEDNRAALPHIVEAGPAALLLVDDDAARLGAAPDDLTVTDLDQAVGQVDVLVRSPGFPRYHPAVESAVAGGVAITNPTDLWIGTFGPDRRVVAVTGTKGKSTTTQLIDHFARLVDLDLGVAGNMGIPVFADEWRHDAPDVALEISSYQAVDLHHLPDVAVLTSLAEDHLSWHQGYDQYVADKLRVLCLDGRTAPTIIVPALDEAAIEATRAWSPEIVASPTATDGQPRHRVQNAALAAAVVRHLSGVDIADEDVLAAARQSLPGRLDVCAERDGVTWVDDALASNPFAAAAGLAWAREQRRPTLVLLGGADRGVASDPLADEVRWWPEGRLAAITLPDNGERLARESGIEIAGVGADVADAVALAAHHAESGSIVLFAPGAPTPPGHGSWRTRSDQLRAAVDGLT